MNSKHLATYLNDHLAGSEMALELLDHLIATFPNSTASKLDEMIRAEVVSDRGELEAIMANLGIHQSSTRKATAWLGEKLTQLKLRVDDSSAGSFRLFEATELISLGIEGKRGLWQTLSAIAPAVEALSHVDFPRLIRRAQEQRERLEPLRIQAAHASFDSPSNTGSES